MNHFQVDEILKSLVILVDTREQPTKKAEARYKSFGIPHKRVTLSFGDYSYNLMVNNKWLYDDTETVVPEVVIERKMNLDELALCFGTERRRFEAEMQRAHDNGSSVYLLVENATWENLINGKYRSRYNEKAFLASITAWMARYDIKTIFCKDEMSGRIIKEILYREAKERIQRNGDLICSSIQTTNT